jgi:AcrR family transcriptional regulator
MRDIAAAGAVCFGRVGYRRTRMAEVASEAGVSAGSIYTYVESKEALFHLVLAVSLGAKIEEFAELPFAAPDLEATVEMVGRELRRKGLTPLLKAATKAPDPPDARAELAAIVSEQYATVGRLRPALSVIEACAADLPVLEEMYFGRQRRSRIDLLVQYLRRRIDSGHLTAMPDAGVAAQIVTETVAWFAWKRFEGRDSERFHEELARRTVVEFVCNALVPARRPT